jgi:hypothetical protein
MTELPIAFIASRNKERISLNSATLSNCGEKLRTGLPTSKERPVAKALGMVKMILFD